MATIKARDNCDTWFDNTHANGRFPRTCDLPRPDLRAGSVCLDRFPRTISGVLPGLLSLPHWGWTKGGRSPTGGPTPMRRGKFHAAAAIDVGRK